MSAVGSLNNFSVPLSDVGASASTQGLIYSKIKLRFRLMFVGFGVTADTTELTRQVVDFKRPTVDFNKQTIDVYNSKVNYAGKPQWSPVTVTLRDDIQGTIQKIVGEQIQKQFDFQNQASATSPSDYKFELLAQVLDGNNGTGEPQIMEEWDLVGCFIDNADYGDNNYASSDVQTIKLSITFDNAVQTDFGVGSSVVARTNGILAT